MNRLAAEKSPYLRQHADNPVDWHPWDEEAFREAIVKDRPIFLSIGYSTCHWCHVMAEESFSDPEVAQLLNREYISIKVDREERPDIDAFYMSAAQALTGRGGWPLTAILTPEKKPFFVGTYFPKEAKYGQVGMMDLLPRLAELWQERREEVEKAGSELAALIASSERPRQIDGPLEALVDLGFHQFAEAFDTVNGGFGSAPKFPTAHNLTFLLRYHVGSGSRTALDMVERTLKSMRRGGIYDQLAGGFHRYSTDERWHVPHFEKMLYDQALLTTAYVHAYQVTGDDEYANTAREVCEYVRRDLAAPGGGFYSALDADSEGEEGRYYYWSRHEIEAALTPAAAAIARQSFGIENQTGNTLRLMGDPEALDLSIRNQLLQVRTARTPPHRDEKILADWNGLMGAAMATAGRALGDRNLIEASERAINFVLKNMSDGTGGLYHRYHDGEAGIPGFIEDHAFIVWALLELYSATFLVDYLEQALSLTETTLHRFWDEKSGGFFQSGRGGEPLFAAQKESRDGALPSGNSVAASNLLRLARLTARADLEARAQEAANSVSGAVRESPTQFSHLLGVIDSLAAPGEEIVVVGDGRVAQEFLAWINSHFRPNTVVVWRDTAALDPRLDKLVPFASGMGKVAGADAAYVCRGRTCERAVTSLDELQRLLGS